MLDCVEIETAPAPTSTVIWMHGLGADQSDFVSIVPHLRVQRATRFVFPNAPLRAVTINNGMVMRAWYDIVDFDAHSRRVDESGVLASRDAVFELISRENQRGIAAEKIIVAGFSQGGAMAYYCGLTHATRLGGVIALSAYLPAPQRFDEQRSPANLDTPVFAAHGRWDNVVPFALGQAAAQSVKSRGNPLTWREESIDHSVNLEEIAAIGAWLNQLGL